VIVSPERADFIALQHDGGKVVIDGAPQANADHCFLSVSRLCESLGFVGSRGAARAFRQRAEALLIEIIDLNAIRHR
jgi:hypothetical protein